MIKHAGLYTQFKSTVTATLSNNHDDEFLLVGAELDDQTCRAIHAIQVDCHRHTE